MKTPADVFSRVLTITLVLALLFTIVATLADVLSSGIDGRTELRVWAGGVGARDDQLESARLPLVAMALFILIPLVTYAITTVSYIRHRNWPYIVMCLLQIVVLTAVALPVLRGL